MQMKFVDIQSDGFGKLQIVKSSTQGIQGAFLTLLENIVGVYIRSTFKKEHASLFKLVEKEEGTEVEILIALLYPVSTMRFLSTLMYSKDYSQTC